MLALVGCLVIACILWGITTLCRKVFGPLPRVK